MESLKIENIDKKTNNKNHYYRADPERISVENEVGENLDLLASSLEDTD